MQGTSRGGADLKEIVRRIDLWGLTHLYVVGGNGGNAAANAINDELEAANVVCSVIAVPKSIDNDILLVGCTRRFDKMLHVSEPTTCISVPWFARTTAFQDVVLCAQCLLTEYMTDMTDKVNCS